MTTDAKEQIEVRLEPTAVPEWEAEDLMGADLADQPQTADASDAKEMLSSLSFRLPVDIPRCELVGYAAQHETPLGASLRADSTKFDFYLITVPVNIVVPAPQRLVRLRLILTLNAEPNEPPIVAWDVFPNDNIQKVDVNAGEVNIDVSKALGFVFPAPVADVLGLKLKFPLGWKSLHVVIDSSGQMSNPVEWYVNDAAITSGFIGYAILRAPKGSRVSVTAQLVGELRRAGVLGVLSTRFRSQTQTYRFGAAS